MDQYDRIPGDLVDPPYANTSLDGSSLQQENDYYNTPEGSMRQLQTAGGSTAHGQDLGDNTGHVQHPGNLNDSANSRLDMSMTRNEAYLAHGQIDSDKGRPTPAPRGGKPSHEPANRGGKASNEPARNDNTNNNNLPEKLAKQLSEYKDSKSGAGAEPLKRSKSAFH